MLPRGISYFPVGLEDVPEVNYSLKTHNHLALHVPHHTVYTLHPSPHLHAPSL
jgi:hypothetical protein